ncbi:AAA family ATPase [Flagellimonas profundi]|uniref:AAA family ATPase n=1 Tax=Flagellimonas profundi TaxID=2915620 RepID=A0ABS3FIV0_9FLAO|nr:AAA family ATPase [Allomuricauda profundi]MBO0343074.1 AAA family ATPase [Allomuricauda profundi]
MRLAAIFLDFHDYLFDKSQFINLGGKYIYEFVKKDEAVHVSRQKNAEYIDSFFDITNLDCRLLSINAVVGQNGAGKSSLLDSIRSLFVRNPNALPSNNTYLFFETENEKELKFISSIYDVGNMTSLNFKSSNDDFAIDENRSNSLCQTIYYSPHFDFKFNPNFDEVDNNDISFDQILEEDLADLQNKNSVSVSQELVFKNSIRQILFSNSKIVQEQNIFKDLFNFPNHGDARLTVRGHKQQNERNIPTAFRPSLKIVKDKLKRELDEWDRIRKFDSPGRVSNQIDVNKYLLKRYILRDLLSVIERQMEKDNTYLYEGSFENRYFLRDSNRLNAYDSFLLFIQNCFLDFDKGKSPVFNIKTIQELLEKLYSAIDAIEDLNKVTNNVFIINSNQAIEILQLQNQFLNNIINYYPSHKPKNEERVIDKSNLIDGFIFYMPSKRKLSSGENAFLNLFSRLYDFLNTKLSSDIQVYEQVNNYILLLDEADLGFHPVWKRKYVNTLVKTIPYFFNHLDKKPNIQIIFTTHDPLTLSDLPNKNIVYLLRDNSKMETKFLKYEHVDRPTKSFAANITDLLADSFFVEDGLIGDFAKNKIEEVISWLSSETVEGQELNDDRENYKNIIEIIDEPILKTKLLEMYGEKTGENVRDQILDEQIAYLNSLKSDKHKQ